MSSRYEPGKIGRINAARAHYDGSYRVTAAFLAYVSDKYDKNLVPKLNTLMRDGKYKDDVFKEDDRQDAQGAWTRSGGPA